MVRLRQEVGQPAHRPLPIGQPFVQAVRPQLPIEAFSQPQLVGQPNHQRHVIHAFVSQRTNMAKTSFTAVGNCADSRKGPETGGPLTRDTSPPLCYTSPARMLGAGEPWGCRPKTSRNSNSRSSTRRNGATK